MATNDLMSELQKDSIKLDDDSERKVVKMLLKLLEDKNGEVQNLAVKWYIFLPRYIRKKKTCNVFHILFLYFIMYFVHFLYTDIFLCTNAITNYQYEIVLTYCDLILYIFYSRI